MREVGSPHDRYPDCRHPAPDQRQSARDAGGRNPATGEVIANVAQASADEVREAVARARAAQPAWEALGFDGRAKILKRAQKWTIDNTDRIARTIVSETGKTYEDALLAEVAYAASAFGFWSKRAKKYLADERVRTSNPFVLGRRLRVRYAPAGVIGVIGPWNYPLTNSFGDCIPALAAGNSVVLKPASLTPLTSQLMLEGLLECGLPEDVYQVVVGPGGEIGNALIDAVDVVMFTGSTEVGKKVMERASQTLTPVSLELGGKDPMIVLRDANLERAANAATYYSMQNGGQTCISVERVYVEEPVYDEFVAKLRRRSARSARACRANRATVEVGADHLARAGRDRRAPRRGRAREGSPDPRRRRAAPTGAGDFFEPTLIADADHSMLCMTEETFGPTLPVMKVPRRRRGGALRQRLAVRVAVVGVDGGLSTAAAAGAAARGRRLLRERRLHQLRRPGAADGRLEGVRAGHPPRRRRDPKVHAKADAADHSRTPGDEERAPLLSVPETEHRPDQPRAAAPVRARPA